MDKVIEIIKSVAELILDKQLSLKNMEKEEKSKLHECLCKISKYSAKALVKFAVKNDCVGKIWFYLVFLVKTITDSRTVIMIKIELENWMSRLTADEVVETLSTFISSVDEAERLSNFKQLVNCIVIPVLVINKKNNIVDLTKSKILAELLEMTLRGTEKVTGDILVFFELLKLRTAFVFFYKQEIASFSEETRLKKKIDSKDKLVENWNMSHKLIIWMSVHETVLSVNFPDPNRNYLKEITETLKQTFFDQNIISGMCLDILAFNAVKKKVNSSCHLLEFVKGLLTEKSSLGNYTIWAIAHFLIKGSNLFVNHKSDVIEIIFALERKLFTSNSSQITFKRVVIQLLALVIYYIKLEYKRTGVKYNDPMIQKTLFFMLKTVKNCIVVNSNSTSEEVLNHKLIKKITLYIKELLTCCDVSPDSYFKILKDNFINSTNFPLYTMYFLYIVKATHFEVPKRKICDNKDFFMSITKKFTLDKIKAVSDLNILYKLLFSLEMEQADFFRSPQIEFYMGFLKDQVESIKLTFNKKKNKYLTTFNMANNLNHRDYNIANSEKVKNSYSKFKNEHQGLTLEKVYDMFNHNDFRLYTSFKGFITQIKDSVAGKTDLAKNFENVDKNFYISWFVYAVLLTEICEDTEVDNCSFELTNTEYFTGDYSYFSYSNLNEYFAEFEKNLYATDNLSKLSADVDYMLVILESVYVGFDIFLRYPGPIEDSKNNFIFLFVFYYKKLLKYNLPSVYLKLMKTFLESTGISQNEKLNAVSQICAGFTSGEFELTVREDFLKFVFENTLDYRGNLTMEYRKLIKRLFFISTKSSYSLLKAMITESLDNFFGNNIFERLKYLLHHYDSEDSCSFKETFIIMLDSVIGHFGKSPEFKKKLKSLKMPSLKLKGKHYQSSQLFPWAQDVRSTEPVKELFSCVRDITNTDNHLIFRFWPILFPTLWKTFTRDQQELFSSMVNDCLYRNNLSKKKGYKGLKHFFEGCISCTPSMFIKPEFCYLIENYSTNFVASTMYLENMINNNLHCEMTYFCLSKLYSNMHDHSSLIGLMRKFGSSLSRDILALYQAQQFNAAEELSSVALSDYAERIGEEDESMPSKIDLSIWEHVVDSSSLESGNFERLKELGMVKNNFDLQYDANWMTSNLDEIMDKNLNVYSLNSLSNFFVKNLRNFNYLSLHNIEENSNVFLESIKHIYSKLSTFPHGVDKIVYKYLFGFQQTIETWESYNFIKETRREGSVIDSKDNTNLWRLRVPQHADGAAAIVSILNTRNHFFKHCRDMFNNDKNLKMSEKGLDSMDLMWNYLYVINFARKNNFLELFHEYYDKFEAELKPETHLKRPYEVSQINYEKARVLINQGLCEEAIEWVNNYLDKNKPTINEDIAWAYQVTSKAYIKQGNYAKAQEEIDLGLAKDHKNAKLWKNYCSLLEESLFNMDSNHELHSDLSKDLVGAYFATIIYSNKKAKYIIPKLISHMVKNQSLFENHDALMSTIVSVPPHLWLFWRKQIFQLTKYSNTRNYGHFILWKMATELPQHSFYFIQEALEASEQGSEQYKIIKSIQESCMHKMSVKLAEKILILRQAVREYWKFNLELRILDWLNFISLREDPVRKLRQLYENVKTENSKENSAILCQFLVDFEQDLPETELLLRIEKWKTYLNNKLVLTNSYSIEEISSLKLFSREYSGLVIPELFGLSFDPTKSESEYRFYRVELDPSDKNPLSLLKKIYFRLENEKKMCFRVNGVSEGQEADSLASQINCLVADCLLNCNLTKTECINLRPSVRINIAQGVKLQEDSQSWINLEDMYECIMQRRGYSADISLQLQAEGKDVFAEMEAILPEEALKLHLAGYYFSLEDHFFHRKIVQVNYSVMMALAFIFRNNALLPNNIEINKETGEVRLQSCSSEVKGEVPFRLTRNISYLLGEIALQGTLPGLVRNVVSAMISKKESFKELLFLEEVREVERNSLTFGNLELAIELEEENEKKVAAVIERMEQVYFYEDNPLSVVETLIKESRENLDKRHYSFRGWF